MTNERGKQLRRMILVFTALAAWCGASAPADSNEKIAQEILALERQAMEREGIESLPMYPEDRPCRHPTARRLIDRFDDIQRHTLDNGRDAPVVFVSELSDLQRRILKLLGVPTSDYHA